MLKYLRIAVTALSLTACVLLVALWVRSYWCVDVVQWSRSDIGFQVTSTDGRLLLGQQELHSNLIYWPSWQIVTFRDKSLFPKRPTTFGFMFTRVPSAKLAEIPLWSLLLVSAVASAVVGYRLPWRFSLRTLLIATTLVAVMLGLVITLS